MDPRGEATVVAVSGPDNVGKSTQIRLLTLRSVARDAGPLDDYDPRWKTAKEQGLARWWFDRAPIEEVVDTLAASYLTRAGADTVRRPGPGLILLDRGMLMLEASVVATAAVREGLGLVAAQDRAHALLEPYAADVATAEAVVPELLLLHDHDVERGVERALGREASVTASYARYQHALQAHLHAIQARADGVIVAGDAPIMDVHQRVCGWLGDRGFADVADPVLTRAHVVALGGLSESGKSTAGAYLQHTHGFARLKIGYLLEAAAARHRIIDVYGMDVMRIAELVVCELDRYAAAHHYQQHLSIESVHSDSLAAGLARLLGDRLSTVYLDVAADLRAQRGTAGPADVTGRDVIKRSRGADRVRGLADVVIDNNGTLTGLYHHLDRLVRTRRWETYRPRTATVAELGLPAHLSRYLHGLLRLLTGGGAPVIDLLAVTGSGSRGKYTDGWSDLDVLMIADATGLPAIRAALGVMNQDLNGVRLGISVITMAECRAGALTSRLLHTLASITTGATPVLWCGERVELPRPDGATVAAASRRDAVMAAIEIRRLLLHEHIDIRALYKVTALLAKIVVNGEGHDRPDDGDALAAFADLLPEPALTQSLREGARTWEPTGRDLATRVLSWWLSSIGESR